MTDGRRRKDPNTMFAVNYVDGRAAYITITPHMLRNGDHVAAGIALDRQRKGEIPEGAISSVRRVR
jgi:hypothetical protein